MQICEMIIQKFQVQNGLTFYKVLVYNSVKCLMSVKAKQISYRNAVLIGYDYQNEH